MKTLLRTTLVAASFLAISLTSRAQILTADTITGWSGAALGPLGDNQGLSQTFTNFTEIESLTFRFQASTGSGITTDIEYYFSEWNTGSNQPTGGALNGGVQTVEVGTGGWTDVGGTEYFDATIDLSAVTFPLNAANTYAISFVGTGASSAAGITLSAGFTNYLEGDGFFNPSGATYADLAGNPAIGPSGDFAFVATSMTPVPEASSAAVLFAGMFVGGLMLRRQRFLRHATTATAEA